MSGARSEWWRVPGREKRFALAFALLLAACGTLLLGSRLVCPGGACQTLPVEAALAAAAQGWRHGALDTFFMAFTWLGSLWVLAPLAVLVALRTRGTRRAAFLPLALLGASVLAHQWKWLVARPRPELFPELVAMPIDASFPSAHTMQAAAFVLAWLLRPGGKPGWATAAVAAAWVTLVALSRVYLQVHFPSDVLFGFGAAVLWVLALRCLPVWRDRAGAEPAG